MDTEAALRALAMTQHALVHADQLRPTGLTDASIRHLTRCGRWEWRGPMVLALSGVPPTESQRALLAVYDLGPGAAISHTSAAARWQLPGFRPSPVHVTGDRVRGRRRLHLATVHQPRLLRPDHIMIVDGVPTTSPGRTLFDLAGTLHPHRVERALDNALVMGLTSIPRLRVLLHELQRRGRPGIRVMRNLLDARHGEYRPPASGLEARFQELAHKAGITTFERQIDIGDDARWIGRVDFVERRLMVAVEIDSDRYHLALLDRQLDRARDAALAQTGYQVVRFTEHQVWRQPADVVARLTQKPFW